MRPPEKRWYASLLKHPRGTAELIHTIFPSAQFVLEKQEKKTNKLVRHVRFDLRGQTIMRARSEIDVLKTSPKVLKLLQENKIPLGIILKKFNIRHTRVKCTSRTRSFHFIGELHGKIWERFYYLPKEDSK